MIMWEELLDLPTVEDDVRQAWSLLSRIAAIMGGDTEAYFRQLERSADGLPDALMPDLLLDAEEFLSMRLGEAFSACAVGLRNDGEYGLIVL